MNLFLYVKDFLEIICNAENGKVEIGNRIWLEDVGKIYQEALQNDELYRWHLENPCWYSSAVKGYRKCRVGSKFGHDYTKGLGNYKEIGYRTAEETARSYGTLLIVPAVGIAISKAVIDDNEQGKVTWNAYAKADSDAEESDNTRYKDK